MLCKNRDARSAGQDPASGKCLIFSNHDNETVAVRARAGKSDSAPMDDNPQCVIRKQKVYAYGACERPGCFAEFCEKPWHIASHRHWPGKKMMVLELERAELGGCHELTTVVELNRGADCFDELHVKRRVEDIPVVVTHLETKNETINDANWCVDYYKLCFDQDLGIEPGFRIKHGDEWLKVSRVENASNPTKLVEVFAHAD